jgi:hypothetical protein
LSLSSELIETGFDTLDLFMVDSPVRTEMG